MLQTDPGSSVLEDRTTEPAPRGVERHDDDELASALEQQMLLVTGRITIVGAAPAAPADDLERDVSESDVPERDLPDRDDREDTLSDLQVVELIDRDRARGIDTLSAMARLEAVLNQRAGTGAIPTRPPRAAMPSVVGTSFEDILRAPTQAIPVMPEPTFSTWIAASAPALPARTAPSSDAAAREAPAATEDAVAAESPSEPEEVAAETPATAYPHSYEPLTLQPSPFEIHHESLALHPDPLALDALPGALDDSVATGSHAVVSAGFARDLDEDAYTSDDVEFRPDELGPVPSSSVNTGRTSTVPEARPQPAFAVEESGLDATALDHRVGHASRMFWLWFAATSSFASVGVGAALYALGLSLRQLFVAVLIGVALSFLPLGLGTLAGKWSGQPTMVVSRATFGLRGNALPAAVALVTRVFWGAVLLWLVAASTGTVFTAQGWSSSQLLPRSVALAIAIALAASIAYFGYALIVHTQRVLTVASVVLVGVMIAVTWPRVDFPAALSRPDASILHVVAAALIVFAYLGLAWANSSAELARYQHRDSSGAASMLWTTFGASLPPLLLVSYGGILAASDSTFAHALAHDPVNALTAAGLPAWYPIPLLLAVALNLVSALVLNIYSGGFILQSLGVRLPRQWSTVAVALAIGVAGIALVLAMPTFTDILTGPPVALAVVVAAWVGIFCSEMMIRTRRLHSPSLTQRGGTYPDWRWVNIATLVIASAVGLGLVRSTSPGLTWEGYLLPLLGAGPHSDLANANLGVIVALALGFIVQIVSGIPAVRRQERETP